MFSKTLFLVITRPHNLLVSENISKLKTKPSTVKAPQKTYLNKDNLQRLEDLIGFKPKNNKKYTS